jgi:hypothetical protein
VALADRTKPVYTIRTKNRIIRFTGNHPLLARVPGHSKGSNAERRPRIEWRRVDELKVGDRVVQVQRLPDQGHMLLPNGQPATTEVMQWLGAYTGDGCLNGDHGVRMCIPTSDRARVHYAAIAGKLFKKQLGALTPGRRAKDGLTEEMVRLRAEGLTFRQIVARMGLSMHPMSVRDRVCTSRRGSTSSGRRRLRSGRRVTGSSSAPSWPCSGTATWASPAAHAPSGFRVGSTS